MDNDWTVNFFDKSRIVSDDEMQNLWSRVLAGERALLEPTRNGPLISFRISIRPKPIYLLNFAGSLRRRL